MWREFIQNNTSHCHFAEPASVHAIIEVEQELNITLPNDLRTLLEETNGTAVSVTFPGPEDEGQIVVLPTGHRLWNSFLPVLLLSPDGHATMPLATVGWRSVLLKSSPSPDSCL